MIGDWTGKKVSENRGCGFVRGGVQRGTDPLQYIS